MRSGSAGRTLRWKELCDAAGGFAQRLRQAPPGALMVASPNRCETHIALLGALWAERDVLPVSPATPPAARKSSAKRRSA